MNRQKAIEDILENFDFERVHKTMTFLNWTWATAKTESGVPSLGELFLKVQEYLGDTYDKALVNKNRSGYGTGGFQYMAEYNQETEEVDYLEVKFVLTEWDYYE